MKIKIKQEIRSKTIPELEKEIIKTEEELAKFRIDLKMGKIKNTSLLKVKSDQLAVAKTILREKESFQ